MKKRGVFVSLFILMFSLSVVSALSTNMNETYLSGETMIVKIQGNILEPIVMQDVIFKRGHVSVPFDYCVEKLGEDYYIWAITPRNEMNYTLTIKNVMTTLGGQIRQIDHTQDFSVISNISDYSVKPGVIENDRNFEVEVLLNEDIDREVSVIFTDERDVVLKPGKNTLEFSINEIYESGMYNVTIGKYVLPAYIRINETRVKPSEVVITNVSNITNLEELRDTNQSGDDIDKERAKYHCYEFPGKICTAEEVCTVEPIVSMDGPCCVSGDCVVEEDEGGSLSWLGWLIAAVIVIVGIYIFMRYKRVRKEKDPVKKRALLSDKRVP